MATRNALDSRKAAIAGKKKERETRLANAADESAVLYFKATHGKDPDSVEDEEKVLEVGQRLFEAFKRGDLSGLATAPPPPDPGSPPEPTPAPGAPGAPDPMAPPGPAPADPTAPTAPVPPAPPAPADPVEQFRQRLENVEHDVAVLAVDAAKPRGLGHTPRVHGTEFESPVVVGRLKKKYPSQFKVKDRAKPKPDEPDEEPEPTEDDDES